MYYDSLPTHPHRPNLFDTVHALTTRYGLGDGLLDKISSLDAEGRIDARESAALTKRLTFLIHDLADLVRDADREE